MSRVDTMLERLPAHLEAAQPGKLLHRVFSGLARDLDVLAAQLAATRRAHRLGEADELVDVLALAALHGITAPEFAVLDLRQSRARAALATLRNAPAGPGLLTAASTVLALWGLRDLDAFAMEPGQALDGAAGLAARDRLAIAVADALSYRAGLEACRTRIARIARRHLDGNGTVAALMEAAAIALDLDLDPAEIEHSTDRFRHAVPVRDRMHLTPPPLPPSAPDQPPRRPGSLVPADEVLGAIENPRRRVGTEPVQRHAGECFEVARRGFEPTLLRLRVRGIGEDGRRTIGPLLINRDSGHGIGFDGAVPPDSELVFEEDGRVFLDGADVTARAYAFQGAVFADAAAPSNAHDFRFDAPATRFAQASPAGALDRDFSFPHAGTNIPMPSIGIGVTRFAFFARVAHAAAGDADAPLAVTPRPFQGVFDTAVLAPAVGETPPGAALLALSWVEHEAFKVLLLLPPRFRAFDPDPDTTALRRHLARALDRFRPAGVALEIGFLDPRWTLGAATLGDFGRAPLAALESGLELWPAPSPAAPGELGGP